MSSWQKKAGRIPNKTILPGWLYQTTRFTAASFLKSENRRARREQDAIMETELRAATSDEAWEQLAPLLDDAMGQLGEKERAAIVLRFFAGKTFAELASASGVSENAAKKRVHRALGKLNHYFSKHGIFSTAAVISVAISTHSVPAAPAALAKTATAVALAKGATASVSTSILINGALKIMAWTKAKTAVVAGAVLILTAGTTMMVQRNQESHTRMDQAKRLDLVFRLFAHSHGGQLPTNFEELQSWASGDPETFSRLAVSNWEIVFAGNLNSFTNPGQTVVLRERKPRQGGHGSFVRAYAFADGHADLIFSPSEDFTAVEKRRGFLTQPAKN